MSRRFIRMLTGLATLGVLWPGPTSMSRAADAAPPVSGSLNDITELEADKGHGDPETWPGAAVYRQHCAACHENQVPKAPQKMFLQMMSGPTIVDSLTHGLMASQGATLSSAQKVRVAEYLSGAPLAAQTAATPVVRCESDAAAFVATQKPARVNWGYHNARFVPAEIAGITPQEAATLELKWAFEFPNGLRARSQPAIAYGAIHVGSHDGTVYALDLETGCARWTFKAGAEVRTAVVPHELDGLAPRVFFGDVIGRVYSVDARTGSLAWSHKVDDHANATLTATPTLHDGVLYVPVSSLEVTTAADPEYECCTFRGSIVALDAADGSLKWKTYTIDSPPKPIRTTVLGTRIFGPSGAPIWNAPMIDASRGLLYVGTGENYSSPADDRSDALMAFRLSDGKLMWSRQMLANDAWNVACMMKNNPNCPVENGPDVDFGAGTILVRLSSGRELLLAGQKNGYVYALDPDRKGELVWKTRVGRGGLQGGVHFGMTAQGDRVFVPISDMKNPRDGRPVDGPPRPGLYALDAASGKVVWSSPAADRCGTREYCDPGISAAITSTPGVVFAGHMDGMFRAYDADTGSTLFEFDSTRPVTTISGAVARGGSYGGAGAAVRNGHVVVNSGYGLYFHMPGNVLHVFVPRQSKLSPTETP